MTFELIEDVLSLDGVLHINESGALRPVFMLKRMVLCPLIKVIIFMPHF